MNPYRLTHISLAIAGLLSSSLVWAETTDTATLENIEVRSKRLTMEQGYKAERSNITGVNTSILDTPYSIDVVTQKQLEDKKPDTLEDAVVGISGLHQANNLAGTLDALTKRGYGGNRDNSILRNGYESTQARNYTATAERVEVLKGPASVLYGMQDPGGVVNVVTKKPQEKAEHSINVSYGSHANRTIGFDSTGGLGNGLAYRFIADYKTKNSWRNFGENTEYIIAPSLSWKNDKTQVLAAYEYQNYKGDFDRGTFMDFSGNASTNPNYGKPLNINSKTRVDDTVNETVGYSHSFQLTGEHKLNRDWTLKAGYSYNLNHYDDWQARVMSYDYKTRTVSRRIDGTRGSDYAGHTFNIEAHGIVDQGENITHKLRVALQAQQSTLELGDMYRSTRRSVMSVDNPVYVGESLTALSSIVDSQSDQYDQTKTAAVLLQDSVYIGDQWILSGGLRGQYYKSESGKGRNSSYFRNYSEGFKVLPQLGAIYLINPRWSTYTNFATSLKPNSSRGTDFGGQEIKPEEGRQFEVGTKYNGDLLSANLALFHIKKKNIAYTSAVNGETYTSIVGKNRSQGVEIDINGKITPKTELSANYTFTDTKILQDQDDPSNVGKAFDSVPRHAAGLTLTYDFGKALGGQWRAGAGARYIGSWGFNYAGSWYKMPSATVYNAFVSYDTKLNGKPLNIRLTGKNLGNKTYYVSHTNATMQHLSIGAPREIGLSAKLSF